MDLKNRSVESSGYGFLENDWTRKIVTFLGNWSLIYDPCIGALKAVCYGNKLER